MNSFSYGRILFHCMNYIWHGGVQNRKLASCRALLAGATTQESTVIVEKDTNITLIGINREGSRNCIDSITAEKITNALVQFEDDDTSPVGVLYGVGGSFSAGCDLKELEQEVKECRWKYLLRPEGSVGPTRRHLRKPVVCSINGFCVASGLELALLCDLRVMEKTAILGFFNRPLGVPNSDGGSVRLAALVGYSYALDLILTGRGVDAKEALSMGLVNRVMSTGTALGQAVNLAFSIAKYPMAALLHDRNSLYESAYNKETFPTAIGNEVLDISQEMLQDMKINLRSFMEHKKRYGETKSWQFRTLALPEWEQSEILHEEAHQGVHKT